MNKEDYPLEYMLIHRMLHDENLSVLDLRDGTSVYVQQHVKTRFRFAAYPDKGVVIMQQNVNKASRYAQRARKGERISWVAPKWPNQGPWRIIDAQVESLFPELFP